MRIEPFHLERWMTTYEMQVRWDIARAASSPCRPARCWYFLPADTRDAELTRLLDLRLGYSEACGSAELRSLIAATYENTSSRMTC